MILTGSYIIITDDNLIVGLWTYIDFKYIKFV